MKFMKTLIAAAGFLALAAGSFAQTAASQESAPTFGYMDAKTGMFHTLSRPLPSAETPAVTPTTGKIVFNVTITISSALPASAVITCLATGGVADAATGEFSNVAAVTAKKTGTTATCTVSVPYSWDLATPAKDIVEFDLSVEATSGTLGSATFYEEAFTAPAITIKVPANGATTTETIATTI